MSEEHGRGGGGGLPAAPQRIPGLPANASLLELNEFRTLNRSASRASIGEQDMAWCHNLVPLNPYYLRAIQDNGSAIYTVPAPSPCGPMGISIGGVWQEEASMSGVPTSGALFTAGRALFWGEGAIGDIAHSHATNRYYFELHVTQTGPIDIISILVGIQNATAAWSINPADPTAQALAPGSDYNSLVFGVPYAFIPYTNNNTVGWFMNSARLGPTIGGGAGNGNLIQIALNFDLQLAWERNVGGDWNNGIVGADPTENVGGISFAGINPGPYFLTVYGVSEVGQGGGSRALLVTATNPGDVIGPIPECYTLW